MCSDLGGESITEDGGKQAGCYSWNMKQNISFSAKPAQLWDRSEQTQIDLRKEACACGGEEFFFVLICFGFNAFQTIATCISHTLYLSSVEMLTFLIKSLINCNLNTFSQAPKKGNILFHTFLDGW